MITVGDRVAGLCTSLCQQLRAHKRQVICTTLKLTILKFDCHDLCEIIKRWAICNFRGSIPRSASSQVQNVVRMLRAGLANSDQVATNIFATDAGEVPQHWICSTEQLVSQAVLCDDVVQAVGLLGVRGDLIQIVLSFLEF